MSALSTRLRRLALALAAAAAVPGCGSGGGGGGGGGSRVVLTPPLTVLAIATAAAPAASVGVPYRATITATGGSAPFAWSAPALATLPPGIALDPSASLSTDLAGTPGAPGVFAFDIRIADSRGQTAVRTLTISVATPLAISTQVLPSAREGAAYSARVDLAGGVAPFTWSVIDPAALPPGIALQPSAAASVVLAGTPAAGGAHAFTLEARDAEDRSVRRTLAIDVRTTSRVFILGDLADPSFTELFYLPVSATAVPAPVRVNDSILPTGGNVIDFEPSPDGRQVAYIADADVDELRELYVVDVSHAAPGIARRVSRFTSATDPDVVSCIWSPDSTRLGYRADAEVNGRFEVYVADVSGTGPVPAPGKAHSDAPTPDGRETVYGFSADSRYLSVRAELIPGQVDLFVADLSATPPAAPLPANASAVPGGDVETFLWAKDGPTLVFVGDQEVPDRDDIFAVTVTAGIPGAPWKLLAIADPLDVGTSATPGLGTALSPDGTRLAFRVIDPASDDRVFVAAMVNGVPGVPVAATPIGDAAAYEWSPDSRNLLLRLTLGFFHLHLVDVSGAAPGALRSVSSLLPAGTPAPGGNWGFTPDGSAAWLRSGNGLYRIVLNPIGAPERLDPIPTSGSGAQPPVQPSPDSADIAFLSVLTSSHRADLYLNAIQPSIGTPARINPPPTFGSGNVIGPLAFTPDSRFLVFRGDLVRQNQPALYVFDVRNGVPGTITPLTPGLVGGADGVLTYRIVD